MDAHIYTDDLRTLIFSPKIVPTLQGLLADKAKDVRCQALVTLVVSMDHSETLS
jgi:hypothetical protein